MTCQCFWKGARKSLKRKNNRPFPSSKNPPFQSEVKCKPFLVIMIAICTSIKIIFISTVSLNLALKQRLGQLRNGLLLSKYWDLFQAKQSNKKILKALWLAITTNLKLSRLVSSVVPLRWILHSPRINRSYQRRLLIGFLYVKLGTMTQPFKSYPGPLSDVDADRLPETSTGAHFLRASLNSLGTSLGITDVC